MAKPPAASPPIPRFLLLNDTEPEYDCAPAHSVPHQRARATGTHPSPTRGYIIQLRIRSIKSSRSFRPLRLVCPLPVMTHILLFYFLRSPSCALFEGAGWEQECASHKYDTHLTRVTFWNTLRRSTWLAFKKAQTACLDKIVTVECRRFAQHCSWNAHNRKSHGDLTHKVRKALSPNFCAVTGSNLLLKIEHTIWTQSRGPEGTKDPCSPPPPQGRAAMRKRAAIKIGRSC